MATKITIAHSPDSDDAFMFYGFASGAVDTEGLEIAQVLADIETLNRAAVTGTYEVTAASFHAFAHLSDKYALLPHGASMGDNYGPMVVVRQDGPTSLDGVTVAIPGLWTSAWLALQLYQSGLKYVVMPFDEILEAVRDGKVEAGLLIHEGQLTYGDEGLRLLVDLGVWWAERTGGLPLPLGGNLIRRDLGPAMMKKVSRMLHASIAHALTHRADALEYAEDLRPRPRPRAHRHLRRHVRERPDARLRRARTHGGPAVLRRGVGEAAGAGAGERRIRRRQRLTGGSR